MKSLSYFVLIIILFPLLSFASASTQYSVYHYPVKQCDTGPKVVYDYGFDRLLFTWRFEDINADECSIPGKAHFCDATQFTISLVKKVRQAQAEPPYNEYFGAFLIRDNYSKAFLRGFQKEYSLYLQDLNLAEWHFMGNALESGLYDVNLVIDRASNVSVSLKRIAKLSEIGTAYDKNPFLQLPFDGLVGDFDKKINRENYGLALRWLGEHKQIYFNYARGTLSETMPQNITGGIALLSIESPERFADTRSGIVLAIAKDSEATFRLKYVRSVPAMLKINSNAGFSLFYGFIKPDESFQEVSYYDGNYSDYLFTWYEPAQSDTLKDHITSGAFPDMCSGWFDRVTLARLDSNKNTLFSFSFWPEAAELAFACSDSNLEVSGEFYSDVGSRTQTLIMEPNKWFSAGGNVLRAPHLNDFSFKKIIDEIGEQKICVYADNNGIVLFWNKGYFKAPELLESYAVKLSPILCIGSYLGRFDAFMCKPRESCIAELGGSMGSCPNLESNRKYSIGGAEYYGKDIVCCGKWYENEKSCAEQQISVFIHDSSLSEPQNQQLMASFINQIIGRWELRPDNRFANKGTPAFGLGKLFVEEALKYNIDPLIAVAFFRRESNFGICPGDSDCKPRWRRSMGNIKYRAGQCELFNGWRDGDFCAYPTWADSVRHWFWLIKNSENYVAGGKTTVSAIVPKYHSGNDYPTQADIEYINDIKRWVCHWRELWNDFKGVEETIAAQYVPPWLANRYPQYYGSKQETEQGGISGKYMLIALPSGWHSGDAAFKNLANSAFDFFLESASFACPNKVAKVIIKPSELLQKASKNNACRTLINQNYNCMPSSQFRMVQANVLQCVSSVLGIPINSGNYRVVLFTDSDVYMPVSASQSECAELGGYMKGSKCCIKAEGLSLLDSVMLAGTDFRAAAHELGHSFGLCDQYSRAAYDYQNASLPEGCRNFYPDSTTHCNEYGNLFTKCPEFFNTGIDCYGRKIPFGSTIGRSLMGTSLAQSIPQAFDCFEKNAIRGAWPC